MEEAERRSQWNSRKKARAGVVIAARQAHIPSRERERSPGLPALEALTQERV